MKLNLFSVPIWIGNIDASKIKIENQETNISFGSEINTTKKVNGTNTIDGESLTYVYQKFIEQLDKSFHTPYTLQLVDIWENFYNEVDFQENHIHAGSDLSFIIYKKIDEARTVFVNPQNNILEAFYHESNLKSKYFGPQYFAPDCRTNQFIIFPSHIEHFVKKTKNAITIAGNMILQFTNDSQRKGK